jgi:hypothetical protein
MRDAGCVRDNRRLPSAPHRSVPVRVIRVNQSYAGITVDDEKQITETFVFRQISTADNMNLLTYSYLLGLTRT